MVKTKAFLLLAALLAPGFAFAGDGAVVPAQGNGMSSPALDTLLGSTQGSIAVRGASSWTGLADVNTGSVLISMGVGVVPAYSTKPEVNAIGVGGVSAVSSKIMLGPPNSVSFANSMDVVNSAAAADVALTSYGSSSAQGSTLKLRAANGTLASPTASASGDILGHISWRGYDGSAFETNPTALIGVAATQAYTATHGGSQIRFQVTPDNSITTADAWCMDQDSSLVGISTGLVGFASGSTPRTGNLSATLSLASAGVIRFGTTGANASGAWAATNGTLTGTLTLTGASIAGSPTSTLGATTTTTLGSDTHTLTDAANIVVGTTTGTKIGTSTSQKIGFYNATPVVQITGSTDVLAGLVTLGLRAASSNPALNLGSGAITAGAVSATSITNSPTSTLGATTVTTLGMGGTLTVGANTLSLASSTVSGTPTWSSSQAITLSTAAQTNVTSLGTLTSLTLSGTLTSNSGLAQGFTTGGLILPNCLTGAPSGAATNGNIVMGADNHLWVRLNGAWSQLDAQTGATPSLSSVLAQGNASGANDIAMASAQKITWNADNSLSRFAAGSLGISNTTNACVFRVYNTTDSTTSPTNSEDAELSWSSNILTLQTNASGTGTVRALKIQPATQIAIATGAALTCKGGTGASGQTGGAATFASGDGGSTTRTGGTATFKSGDSGATSGSVANAILSTGASSGTLAAVPAVTMSAGGFDIAGGTLTGTDQSAQTCTVSTQVGTGAGGSGGLSIKTGFSGASSSTAHSQYHRLYLANTFACSTTSATANTFLLISNAVSNSGVSAEIQYTIEVIDGSNHASTIGGSMWVSGSNRNGTVTATCTTAGTSNQAISDTTTFTSLASTTTATVSGTNIQCKVTPSWAAGTPTTVRITYQVRLSGQGNATPQ